MGGTQVAGAVRSLLATLLAEPERARPRTLYFFSDMQFHPPAEQTFVPVRRFSRPDERKPEARLPPLDPRDPPLLALLKMWRETLGPVNVVLWNLAAYDASPAPSGMDHVLMVAGFDAQSFRHVAEWQARGSPGGTARARRRSDAPRRERRARRHSDVLGLPAGRGTEALRQRHGAERGAQETARGASITFRSPARATARPPACAARILRVACFARRRSRGARAPRCRSFVHANPRARARPSP
jgi:hypothetical protein